MTALYTHNMMPTALVAECDGRWYRLCAPWETAWASRMEIPPPLPNLIDKANLHRNSPLVRLSDIPHVDVEPVGHTA